MADTYVNTGVAPLGIPGVAELVAPGDTCEISKDAMKSKGVLQFIAEGKLTEKSEHEAAVGLASEIAEKKAKAVQVAETEAEKATQAAAEKVAAQKPTAESK